MSRTLCVCGVLALVLSLLALVFWRFSPAEPTAEQIQKARADFAALGASYDTTTDPRTKQAIHAFLMPKTTQDHDLKTLPNPPFAFTLNLTLTQVGNAGLKELAVLKNLTTLKLSNTAVTSAGLKELAALKNLTDLDLRNTEVTDAGVKELAALKNLTHLDLRNTEVTDAGVKELAPLKNLTYLLLEDAKVTDGTLRTLREIGLLHALSGTSDQDGKMPTSPDDVLLLDLSHTPVTDRGLMELAPLKNLTDLRLDRKQVTDGTLRALREIGLLHALGKMSAKGGKRPTSPDGVVSLDLNGTPVTDAGLKELAALKNLTDLDLRNTEVTDAGLGYLRQALPSCQIFR
jgi:internalin A